MSKPEAPPPYTNRHLEDDASYIQPPQQAGDEPVYFEDAAPRGWTVIINKRRWNDGHKIFVSKDAAEKYETFRESSNEHILELQRNGIGMPLLKTDLPFSPFSSKFLTFSKYIPNKDGRFDDSKDFHVYCDVRRSIHRGYNTYVFNFIPDPDSPDQNFQIFMFAHSTYPICDYKYKGQVHRWVDVSSQAKSKSYNEIKYAFKHTVLNPGQPSLVDNWDGCSNKLDKTKPNPFLKSMFKLKLTTGLRLPKPEYFGKHCPAFLGEQRARFRTGYGQVKIDDLYSTDPNVNYESVLSMHDDALVLVCVATVLKKQKDNDEDARTNGSYGFGTAGVNTMDAVNTVGAVNTMAAGSYEC